MLSEDLLYLLCVWHCRALYKHFIQSWQQPWSGHGIPFPRWGYNSEVKAAGQPWSQKPGEQATALAGESSSLQSQRMRIFIVGRGVSNKWVGGEESHPRRIKVGWSSELPPHQSQNWASHNLQRPNLHRPLTASPFRTLFSPRVVGRTCPEIQRLLALFIYCGVGS